MRLKMFNYITAGTKLHTGLFNSSYTDTASQNLAEVLYFEVITKTTCARILDTGPVKSMMTISEIDQRSTFEQ